MSGIDRSPAKYADMIVQLIFPRCVALDSIVVTFITRVEDIRFRVGHRRLLCI